MRAQACYCNGGVSSWSAQRVLDGLSSGPSAGVTDPVRAAREGRPVQLTAEMVFPFLLDDYASLRPLKARCCCCDLAAEGLLARGYALAVWLQ